jgi:hypothetical protein
MLYQLWQEVKNDPAGLSYAGKTDAQVAALLNARTRQRLRASIPTWEIVEATRPADWAALSVAEKQRYQAFVSAGTLNPNGTNTQAAFQSMFAGTATLAALVTLAKETVSRAEELGLGEVEAVHVWQARREHGGGT